MVDFNRLLSEEPSVNAQTEKAFSVGQANMAQYLRGNEEGDLTREDLIGNKNFINDARAFLTNRQGGSEFISMSNEDVFESFMNHFRHQDVNEVTALKDLQYAQDLADKRRDKVDIVGSENARKQLTAMHNMTVAYDKITGEAGSLDFFMDYAGGLVRAPSTWLGIITGGAGKAGAIAGQQAIKFGLRRVLAAALKGSIAPMAIEGTAGAIQGAAQQKTRQEVGLEGDPLLGGAIGFAGGAVGAGVLGTGLGALRYTKGYKAGALAREGTLARKARAEEAQRLTNLTLRQKHFKDNQTFFREDLKKTAEEAEEAARKRKKKPKKDPLPKEKVETGTKIEEEVSPAGYLAGLDDPTVDRIIAATLEIAESVGWTIKGAETKRITMLVADTIEMAGQWESKKVDEYGSMAMYKSTLGAKAEKNPYFSKEDLVKIADKYNLTPDQLAMVFIADASKAGRLLGKLSGVTRRLTPEQKAVNRKRRDDHKRLMERLGVISPEMAEILDTRLANAGKAGQQTWEILKNVDVLRRGLMVVQPKTTIRNLMNAGIRAPIYMLDHGLNDLLQHGRLTGFKSALKLPYDFLSRGDAEALALIFKEGNPLTYQRVFREAMDLNEELGAGSGFARVGRKINVLNTLLDNGIKKSIFLNEIRTAIGGEDALKAYMRGKGGAEKNLDFNDWFRQNPDLAAKAMDEALAFTYQKGFKDKGRFSAGWITKQSANPVFTAFIPFPRFLVNQTQFMYEHMPLLSFAGAAVKKAKDKPLGINMRERFTKQATGALFLYGALQVRAMQGPETPWNYIKDQNTGLLYDITALLGPFAPFFFTADFMLRANKGKLAENVPVMTQEMQNQYEKTNWDEINWRDVSKAFTGMQIKGGIDTGFVVLDELFTGVATMENPEQGLKILTKFAANYARTFTIPVGMFKDVDATFDPEGRKIMDTDSVDLLGLFIRKALAGLPETKAVANFETYLGIKPDFSDALRQARAEGEEEQDRLFIPTGTDVERKVPLSATFLGATARQPFNLVERELGRLNKPYYWWYGKEKNVVANRLMKKHMGIISDDLVPAIVGSDIYQQNNARDQVVILSSIRSDIRKMAKLTTVKSLEGMELTQQDQKEISGYPKASEADKLKFEGLSRSERLAAKEKWEELYPNFPPLENSNMYLWGIGYVEALRKIGKLEE